MNTKWQKQLIKSLALSPYLFEDFVIKQNNKQMLWQFVKRIWPYRKLGPNNYDWMNVGIEIEHIALNSTQSPVCKRILQLNCTSYDSGYDNDHYGRANENRIRLNGIKGLKGLHYLLSNMQQENCVITPQCGLHCHIDAIHVYRNIEDSKLILDHKWDKIISSINDKLLLYTNEEKSMSKYGIEMKLLSVIFNIPIQEMQMYLDSLRFKHNYHTIEHRYLYTSLCYSEYVIQILTCIHITDRFCKNLDLNKSYLLLLFRVIKEIRNKNYSI